MTHTCKLSALACAAILSSTANADTILGGYIGAQAWNMGASGGFAQNESIAEFEFDEETNSSFYAALEHPIPLIPNIKLARTTLDTTGSSVVDTQFTFGGEVYLINSELDTTVDITATDYILYYEILDTDIVSIDLGVSAKQIEGDFVVVDQNGNTGSESFDGFIPMAYGKVQLGLPLTGLGLYAEGSFLSIDDDSFTDYQVALTYSFVESLALDLTLQAGYRNTSLEVNDLDDVYADLEFDGVFIGLEFDF
jgi:outer membrane protein